MPRNLLLLLILAISESRGLRILGIFPLPSKSHFIQGEALMRGLAVNGHRVDVYGHFPSKKSLTNNYTDYSLAGSLPSLVDSLSYDYIDDNLHVASIPKLIDLTGTPVCRLLELPIFQKLIHDPPTDPPYDIVVVELFTFNCYLAFGRHLGVPIIGVVTMSLLDWMHEPLGNPTNLAAYGSVFSNDPLPKTFVERLRNVYSSIKYKFTFDWATRREQDVIVREHFGTGYPSAVELQKDLALVLVNHHHVLNGPRPYMPNVVPIPGAHIVDGDQQLAPEVQKFLDDSEHGFIYFSFGSLIRIETFPERFIDALYDTFRKIAPVRVIMKVFKSEALPTGLSSNVMTRKWLPQVAVLKHRNIKGFVTHGGVMGTQEAIYYGVPIIGFPIYGDQHFNVKSCVKLDMAVQLHFKDVTRESFSKAVTAVLHDPKFKKSAERMRDIFKDVPMSPVNTTVFWVEYVARHGKDILRSPIVDMTWWQTSLLDIYVFLAVILFSILYIAKITIALLIKIFLSKKYENSEKKDKIN